MENYKATKNVDKNSLKNNSSSTSYNGNIKKAYDNASNFNTNSVNNLGTNKISSFKNGVEGAQNIINNVKDGNDEPLSEENVSKVVDGLSETNIPYVSEGAKVVKGIDKVTDGKASKEISKIGNKTIKRTKFKIKLMIGLSLAAFIGIFLLMFVVFADENEENMELTNNTTMTSKSNTLSSNVSDRIVNIDLNNLIINNDTSNPIYVINITSGFNIDEAKNLISEFVDNNNIEDYFITNSSSDITDDELYIIYNNRLVDKNNLNDSIIDSGLVKISNGNTLEALEELANWYIENIKTYGTDTFKNPFFQGVVRNDCSGFASAYMSLVSNNYFGISSSAEMISTTGTWANKISQYGWKAYLSDEVSDLVPGDVLVSSPLAIAHTKGHVEIYVNENSTFGWGSVKKSYPTNNSITATTINNRKVYQDSYTKNRHTYSTIYRYEG